ncbi:MAG TPA: FAD-binding protein, partial [Acetobacteraceae bacterium]|nr:FAD-binding protein [Acetobacteraceae bacterium]
MNIRDFAHRPVVVGAGLAGLRAALGLQPEPVLLVTSGTLESGAASLWSQGGIAAAIGADDDAGLHAADTIAAGDGLCDQAIAARITAAAPAIIEELIRLGAAFDRDASGRVALGLEAAHGRRRIAHAGDRTGLMLTAALAR